jgi:DNA-binding NarL/FixJ family response regulator
MVRQGLRSLVEKEPGLKIIGEAADGRTAVRICLELKPDLVVMDLTMPELNGMAAAQQILAVHPGIKILVLSMHADRRFVAQTLGAGASGYLVKDNAFEELVKAIQAIMGGKSF